MVHTIHFDSEKCEMLGLASGHISRNKIIFETEKIAVTIEARTGEIAFCDLQEAVLAACKVTLPLSGDEKFSEVKCCVEDGQIRLGFPKYTYKDHYPNCDGEHDRWTKTISGFDFVCFDLNSRCII